MNVMAPERRLVTAHCENLVPDHRSTMTDNLSTPSDPLRRSTTASTTSSLLPNDHVKPGCRFASLWTSGMAFGCSFVAMVVGLSLLLVSMRQTPPEEASDDPSTSLVEQNNAQWLAYRQQLAPNTLIDPYSSQDRALQWLVTTSSGPSAVPLEERYALAVMYYTWMGPTWSLGSGWMVSANECEWSGIECNDNSSIIGVDLSDASVFTLSGTLPVELSFLTTLQHLRLAGQGLQGSFPTALQRLTSLIEIDMTANRFTSISAPDTGMWTALEVLKVGSNRLSDRLPNDFGHTWSHFRILEMHGNSELSAEGLWDSLSAWPFLQVVSLAHSGVATRLPTDLGQLVPDLRVLDLGTTQLSGSLPTSIGNLTNLELLSVSNPASAGLHGSLPTEIGRLTRLSQLDLEYNPALYTTLPTEMGNLASLKLLSTRFMDGLHGTIPTEFGQLSSLSYFTAHGSKLSGTIPSELANCRELVDVDFGSNELTGTMPEEVCANEYERLIADCLEPLPDVPPKVICDCCSYCYRG